MSRYFIVQSWVGSHENEPDYNGNQCGERNVRSSEVVPLYDQYGNANIQAFSDEALLAKKKAQTKPKLSAFDKVCTTDRSYEKLCALSEELDNQLDLGEIDLESWAYARKQLDKKLERSWEAVKRLRGWTNDNEPVLPCAEEFTLDIEASKGLSVDLSIIPKESVFSNLSDGNSFKIFYAQVLTVVNKVSRLWNVSKQILEEGLT